jgi:hypothetical protein
MGKPSSGHAFVCNAILGADHGNPGSRPRPKRFQGFYRVLGLHGQIDSILLLKGYLRWMSHAGDGQGDGFFGGLEDKAPALNGLQVLSPGDEQNLMTVLKKPGPEGSADAARPVNDVPHARAPFLFHPVSPFSAF